jgi:hypothetical protein
MTNTIQKNTLKTGDMVFVWLQFYKQTMLRRQGKNKIQIKLYGPYKVWAKMSELAYAQIIPTREDSMRDSMTHI